MADRIRHRGPDDSGIWTDAEAGVAIAHRRLAIIDLSIAGHQPMMSVSGRWVLAYNGEIYKHLDLRLQLEAEGHAFAWRGHSDTETLLACIDTWGIEATLKHCVGMFAIALWDRSERALWLARDRMGEKPLYYGWQGDTFLFGSELKALRAHPAFKAEIDRGALALLLRHNYIPAPYSIYQGIHKLPPGTWLRLGSNQREVMPMAYWSLAEVAERGMTQPFVGTEGEALAGLEQRLGDSVRGQMMSDVPLGALLSGGIDSSLITALMQANSTQPVYTFTIGFDEKQYDEAEHARAIATHLRTDHTELRVNGLDALAVIPELPAIYDEPFADSSQLPTHLVMKLARKNVTVVLSGDGGDELFGGYNSYFRAPRAWRRIRWMPAALRYALGNTLAALPASFIDGIAGPLTARFGLALSGDKVHGLGRRLCNVRSCDDLFVSMATVWANAERMVLNGNMPINLIDERKVWPRIADPIARMLALDSMTYLPDDILVKVDRAAMAVSLETRAPFLDCGVVEYAWTLPMTLKLRNGKGKWLLRQLLNRYVPNVLFDRPKMGFSVPLDQWLRGPLREWAETLLAEDRLRHEGFFDPTIIRETWNRHLRNGTAAGYRLWPVLMFQAWLENIGHT